MSAHGTDQQHTLSGTLGVGSIVFMVVAAAAPLTVIAGTVPLGIAAGNGAGVPDHVRAVLRDRCCCSRSGSAR